MDDKTIEITSEEVNGKLVYNVKYLKDVPKQRVVKVYPYSTALLVNKDHVKVCRELLSKIEELVPKGLRDNKIVVIVEDDEAFGSSSKFAVWFKDYWAVIGRVDEIRRA